jgi:soluble lytic murein transglycosylase-like protein
MQLMPSTAAEYRVTNAYDPAQNIRAGVAYLKSLLTRFNNDISLALAAYNAGPGAVEKYGNTVPPYKETRGYVARIKANTPGQTASPNRVVRTVKIVNGQTVVRYTNKPAADPAVVTASFRQ